MYKTKYQENCEQHHKDIVDRFEVAKTVDKFWTKDEIQTLLEYQFQNAKRVKASATGSNIQPVVAINDLFENVEFVEKKFKELLGDYAEEHTGNFYITTQPHDCHVDLLTEQECIHDESRYNMYKNLVPWKSVVMPLFITRHPDEFTSTAFMKQRRLGHSVTFDRLGDSAESDYKLAKTYNGLVDILGEPLDGEHDYNDWNNDSFPHIDKENFRGFGIETILHHKVGDIMLFDACQVHASMNNPKFTNWLKNGINIQFYKEV